MLVVSMVKIMYTGPFIIVATDPYLLLSNDTVAVKNCYLGHTNPVKGPLSIISPRKTALLNLSHGSSPSRLNSRPWERYCICQ